MAASFPIRYHRLLATRIPFVLGILAAGAGALATPTYEEHAGQVRILAPSEATVGDTLRVVVWVGTRWGREGPEVPTAGVESDVFLDLSVDDPSGPRKRALTIPAEQHGRAVVSVVFRSPGLGRVRAAGPGGLAGSSAPIRVTSAPPPEHVYWGDLHGHLHTPGAGHAGRLPAGEYDRILREGLAFARDTAALDFAAFSPHLQTAGGLAHADDAGRTPWEALLAAVADANAPGTFVAFPAFEWQGNEGDHIVLYPGPGPLEAPAEFAALCRSVRSRGALLTAHAVYLPSEFTADAADLDGVEVMRDTHDTQWLGISAIEHGIVPAFLGCSDTHAGALGAASLTGLRAPSLTPDNVFAAIRAGRTWATNGERIVLDFSVDTTGALPRIDVSGIGTAPIERIEVYRNGHLIRDERDFGEREEFDLSSEDDDLLRTECVTGPVIYHVCVVQTSNQRYDPTRRDQAISSPIAVEIRAAQFDAAHARRGGADRRSPGAALVRWRRERSDDATRDVVRLAVQDSLLVDLAAALRDRQRAELARRRIHGVAPVLPGAGASFEGTDREPRSSWEVPDDPRVWTSLGVETPRGRELRRAFEHNWGYTAPDDPPAGQVAARLRIVAHGNGSGAHLENVEGTWRAPVRATEHGWVVDVPAAHVPLPGRPGLRLAFESPVRVERVFVEDPQGDARPALGRATAFSVDRSGPLARATVDVEDAPLVAEIACVGKGGAAPVWSGRLEPGRRGIALPAELLEDARAIELRWGFAGWRRECGTVIPGHAEARALGFGALNDGRATVALADTLLIVDPSTGEVRSVGYPRGARLEAGREFCMADLGDGRAVARGADGPGGGWSARLDLDGMRWLPLEPGPETGTVVAGPRAEEAALPPDGRGSRPADLLWLTGHTLHRRSPDGHTGTVELDVGGRLLGVARTRESVVRLSNGDALRLTPDGRLRHRLGGPVLAAGPTGDALVLEGLSARHPEVSTGIRLSRALPDGATVGPFAVDLRPSPAAAVPVVAAFTPDGTLLLLGGSDFWRREPEHDWWGAAVERWQPMWADTLRGP